MDPELSFGKLTIRVNVAVLDDYQGKRSATRDVVSHKGVSNLT